MEVLESRLQKLSAQFRVYLYSDPERAFAIMSEGVSLALEHGEQRWHISFLIAQAEVRLLNGRAQEALDIIESALPRASQFGDPEMLAKAHGVHASIRRNLGNGPEQIIEELLLAREFAKQTSIPRLQIWILQALADAYCHDSIDTAFDFYQEVLSHEAASPAQRASALTEMSKIHLLQEDYHSALTLSRQSYELLKDTDEVNSIGASLLVSGKAMMGLDQLDAAIDKFEEVLRLGGGKNTNSALGELGMAYLAVGRLPAAKEILQKALSTENQYHNVLVLRLLFAKVLVLEGNKSEALEEVQAVESQAATAGEMERAALYPLISQVFELLAMWEQAFRYGKLKADLDHKLHAQRFEQRLSALNRHVAIGRERIEKERQLLRAERLERELTTQALQLTSQAELLTSVRQDLQELVRDSNLPRETVKKMNDRLKTLPCKSVDWKKFDTQFKAVHPDFVHSLTTKHPMLSAGDVRLCSLVRMQMKSDEIARLFCLSERSVETHRFRVRKKLQLERSEDLTLYLTKI
ncbi:MAG: hypothetical protein Q8922_09115 [Bacteroidota bacterium]|nr:hypothetical protein [Bacteroidota bacterium]MDP4234504.1 hypothetical protein [Bacteroidota bacterium]MDP4242569.1 hypothetical protein [Bacteroidota bacterium]MDP4288083.1 hypothetical protein [Bacteroidota bacterium]